MMGNYKDTNYLHISARIKYLETRLFGADTFEKMLDAKTPEDCLRIVIDSGYDISGITLRSVHDYEFLLQEEEEKTFEFIEEALPEKEIFDIFCLSRDYQNIKAILKAELLNVSPENMLLKYGTIPIFKMIPAIQNRDASVLTGNMFEAVEKSLEAMAKTNDPQQIDLITDKLCYKDILKLAKRTNVDFVIKYIISLIDLINIRTFIRLHTMGRDIEFFKNAFIPGELPLEFFEEKCNEPIHAFLESLMQTTYSSIAERLLQEFSITRMEYYTDEYIGKLIKACRYIPFGPGIPVAYLLSKEAEIKNIRIILTGKLAGITPNIIKERLRLGYV